MSHGSGCSCTRQQVLRAGPAALSPPPDPPGATPSTTDRMHLVASGADGSPSAPCHRQAEDHSGRASTNQNSAFLDFTAPLMTPPAATVGACRSSTTPSCRSALPRERHDHADRLLIIGRCGFSEGMTGVAEFTANGWTSGLGLWAAIKVLPTTGTLTFLAAGCRLAQRGGDAGCRVLALACGPAYARAAERPRCRRCRVVRQILVFCRPPQDTSARDSIEGEDLGAERRMRKVAGTPPHVPLNLREGGGPSGKHVRLRN